MENPNCYAFMFSFYDAERGEAHAGIVTDVSAAGVYAYVRGICENARHITVKCLYELAPIMNAQGEAAGFRQLADGEIEHSCDSCGMTGRSESQGCRVYYSRNGKGCPGWFLNRR